MNAPKKSEVSYSAAATIFAAITGIAVVSGLFPAMAAEAVAPEKAPSVQQQVQGKLSLKDWQLLAK